MRAKLVEDESLFSKSNKIHLIHLTNDVIPKISHNPERIIPHSISCNKSGGSVWVAGKHKFIFTIKPGSKILNLDAGYNGNFYNFGKKTDTPINRGIEIYKYAMKHNVDIIKLKNVPQVGTEYDILNIACIESTKMIK